MTKGLLVLFALSLTAPAQHPRPQAFRDPASGAIYALFEPQTKTVRIAKSAPSDLVVCFADVCRTRAEWLKFKP